MCCRYCVLYQARTSTLLNSCHQRFSMIKRRLAPVRFTTTQWQTQMQEGLWEPYGYSYMQYFLITSCWRQRDKSQNTSASTHTQMATRCSNRLHEACWTTTAPEQYILFTCAARHDHSTIYLFLQLRYNIAQDLLLARTALLNSLLQQYLADECLLSILCLQKKMSQHKSRSLRSTSLAVTLEHFLQGAFQLLQCFINLGSLHIQRWKEPDTLPCTCRYTRQPCLNVAMTQIHVIVTEFAHGLAHLVTRSPTTGRRVVKKTLACMCAKISESQVLHSQNRYEKAQQTHLTWQPMTGEADQQ